MVLFYGVLSYGPSRRLDIPTPIGNNGPMNAPFHSIYAHGFVRACVCIPFLRVADPDYNVAQTLGLARRASEMGAAVALFPELGLSAYSNEDLFHQDALLEGTLAALDLLVAESRDMTPLLLVGAPLRFGGQLFNCAVAVYRGRILGLTPKSYLPNYREFYEKRQFTSARDAVSREVTVLGQRVPLGNDLIYSAENVPDFAVHTEICEDVWTPVPPPPMPPSLGRPSLPTCPLPTSPSARPSTAATCAPPSPAAASPPTCIRRRGRASPPPTSPGTATRSSTRTTSGWPRRSGSPPTSRSSPPTLTWSGCPRTGCA